MLQVLTLHPLAPSLSPTPHQRSSHANPPGILGAMQPALSHSRQGPGSYSQPPLPQRPDTAMSTASSIFNPMDDGQPDVHMLHASQPSEDDAHSRPLSSQSQSRPYSAQSRTAHQQPTNAAYRYGDVGLSQDPSTFLTGSASGMMYADDAGMGTERSASVLAMGRYGYGERGGSGSGGGGYDDGDDGSGPPPATPGSVAASVASGVGVGVQQARHQRHQASSWSVSAAII